jgi:hypothetical protein
VKGIKEYKKLMRGDDKIEMIPCLMSTAFSTTDNSLISGHFFYLFAFSRNHHHSQNGIIEP